ncbi:MAG: NAD-dependent epimerase/dehydratase family protein, partial [Betaproteobacteria bacterium]|nr:NAD-dependent epimerase/dehydratase family protein [Betaproteobacteria bacterium]
MKRVLILGGSGFVGRHLCEALQKHDVQITVPTRRLPARSVQMLPR